MLPESLHNEITALLSEKTDGKINIEKIIPLSGGSINNAFRLETDTGNYFMKYNRASAYPGMFEQEARGLELLRGADEIRVPEVILPGDEGTYSFIILEYLDSATKPIISGKTLVADWPPFTGMLETSLASTMIII